MQADTLGGGFAAPAHDAARVFRATMEAMARPGTIHAVTGARPPAPLSAAAGAALLTLCDGDTPLYLAGEADTPETRAWIAFHCGAPLTGPAQCAFAVGPWQALLPLQAYPIGSADYPDRSATLIVECSDLRAEGVRLTGPGIRDTAFLSLPDVPALQANAARAPLGLDFLLTCGDHLAALPRSTRIGEA